MLEFAFKFSNKEIIIGGILTMFSIYQWLRYIKVSRLSKKKLMHFEKHNCVVMYRDGLMEGWPEPGEKDNLEHNGLVANEAPILYFISTATKSLDIAVMLLMNDTIETALIDAAKRKVRVRLILAIRLQNGSKFLANLIKLGIYNFFVYII